MELLMKTRTLVWGRAGARCAFPDCRKNLIYDASETDDESLVGDIAHIVAESPDGPRGEFSLSDEERRKYSNLLLLCKNHHKLIDDQPGMYTVEKLQQMKSEHESWVRTALSLDQSKLRDHELYADILDQWANAVLLESWSRWTYSIFCLDRPIFRIEHFESLKNIRLYLFGRIWPRRYPGLEDALMNFGDVCGDLCNVFSEHAVRRGDRIETEKFYKLERHPQDVYDRLLKEFNEHVRLVEDLATELTRAANYVCDKVREFLEPSYRLREGALLIESGPFAPDFSTRVHRAEYSGPERTAHPYPGLERFMDERKRRLN